MTGNKQTTDGNDYDTSYTYNLGGALIDETYPSGRVVKNTLDADGQLSQVQSKKNASSGYWTYMDAISRDSAGNVKKMQLGNGRWETADYNNRGQVKQIGLGTTDSTQDLLKLEYKYDTSSTSYDNNGSMREQKITVPTVGGTSGFTATQTYAYDDLNRIASATESISSTTTWKQTFVYDRYGNRNFDTSSSGLTTTLGSCSTAVCNPTISTSTNRISSSGYTFDANGNMAANAAGERFGYDAENHQKEFFTASNSGSTPDATYVYDGDGKRIKKVSSTETTVFVYDGGSQMIAEYSTALATTPQVSYLTQDHLGSPRVVTNENGAVTSRKDYAAFGEETSTSQRVSGLGYIGSSDELREGYTGYEKDSESGLDYAQARYYNPQHGRYTSVDPMTASATIRNPQTFNRYSYVLNSPYKFTDPLGLVAWSVGGACGSTCPGSTGYIDGSSIRGRDATYDWATFAHADVGIAGPHEAAHEGSLTVQNEDNVVVVPTSYVYYDVSGGDPDTAMSGADASKQDSLCPKGYAGCTDTNMTKTAGAPGIETAKKVKGGYEVTEKIYNPIIKVTPTVYLPKWKEYATASKAAQEYWDGLITNLKKHEDGHVSLAVDEANITGKALNAALPQSRTFFTKSTTAEGITNDISLRWGAANKVVGGGWTRWRDRDHQFEIDTHHGQPK